MQNNNSKAKNDLNKRSYQYSLDIINFIESLDQKNFTVEIISKQLIRSATSIGANIIEAQAGRSKKDFSNFLNHTLKSANETKFWICLLRDSHKANTQRCNTLLNEAIELSNILGASILTLKGKR